MNAPAARRARPDLRVLIVASTIILLLVAAARASAVERIQQSGMFNGPVRAISEPDAAGIRYLGGTFTSFNAWNTGPSAVVDGVTGEVDPSFPAVGPAGNATVFDTAPDGSGGFFIAGEFGTVDGQARNGLAHILADGSVDPAWTAGLAGSSPYIQKIQLVGGVLYVVGHFEKVAVGGSETTRYNAAAFDATTGAVTPWNPAAQGSQIITSIVVDASAGRAYLGGNFQCVNARVSGSCSDAGKVARRGLAAVDLTTGNDVSAFNAAFTGGVVVEALALSAAGDWLYLGGTFATVNGQSRTNAAAIRTDGSNTVGAWAPNPDGTNGKVLALAIGGSSLYMGGTFSTLASGGASVARQNLAAVSLDPTAAAVATPLNVSFSSDSSVSNLSLQGAGLYVCGDFSAVDGTPRFNVAKLSLAGALLGWDPNPDEPVRTIRPLGDDVLIGGFFSQAGGEKRTNAAAVDSDGYLTDWSVDLNSTVSAILARDGKIFVGGSFTEANGTVRNLAAAFDATGTLDPLWNPDLGPYNPYMSCVCAMAAVGSTIYLGGYFQETATTSGSPITRNNAAAFTTGGALDPNWDPDPDDQVSALTALGSTVFLGGYFTSVGGTTRNYAAAVDATGTPTSWDPDPNNQVSALAALGSTVFLGGDFTSVGGGGTPRNYAAAVDATTGTPSNWDPNPDDVVLSMAVSGSTVYLGGYFTTVGGTTRDHTAAVDATAGTPTDWNPGPNDNVISMAVSGSAVYLGGDFSSFAGGIARTYSAAASVSGTILDPWPRLGTPTSYTLTVAKQGSGSGTVTSSPAGIDCGATCAYAFAAGRSIVLTATPASGSSFIGWGGACSSTATTCSVLVDQARSVAAEFSAGSAAGAAASTPKPKGVSSLRVLSTTAMGRSIGIRVRVSGSGRLRVIGTAPAALVRAARVQVCSAGKATSRAGVVTIVCPMNAAARALLAQASLKVRVAIAFTPSSGKTRRATRFVYLRQLTPSAPPVTG